MYNFKTTINDEVFGFTEPKIIKILNKESIEALYPSLVANWNPSVKAKVYKSGESDGIVDLSSRIADWLDIKLIDKTLILKIEKQVAKWINNPVEQIESQLLCYSKGYFFNLHCDNSVYDDHSRSWINNDPDRHFSTILYLSDYKEFGRPKWNEFVGGELVFRNITDENNNQFIVKPKAGELCGFPSGPSFQHRVLRIESGIRFCLISFWKLKS